jgi:hypothetical protein
MNANPDQRREILIKKLLVLTVAGAFAVAVPATAHPSHPSHPASSHSCRAHKVAYIAYGRLVSWSATKNGDGTWSGTIVVHVNHANHHAKTDVNGDVTYTLDHARVKLGEGVSTPPHANDKVKVIGKITFLPRHCDHTGFTPHVTVRQVVVHSGS